MKKGNETFTVFDIYFAAWLYLHGFTPNLILQGKRVSFEFPADENIFKLSNVYNTNPTVPVLDFTATVRKLKAKMFAMKIESQ